MRAKIYKSPKSDTYRVEERGEDYLYYTNHDTLAAAIEYCIKMRINFDID